jgi:hypothetical protein
MKRNLPQAGRALLLLLPWLMPFTGLAPAAAQEKNTTGGGSPQPTRIRTDAKVRQMPAFTPVTVIVESFETQSEIMGLFKPAEITWQQVLSPTQSMHEMTMQIWVKDPQHLVLRYFRKGARLYYRGQLYNHNVLPEIDAARVMKLEYHSATEADSTGTDSLEVIEHDPTYVPQEPVLFAAQPWRPKYYDVDGKIIPADEIASVGLVRGAFTDETLHGKEAAFASRKTARREKYEDAGLPALMTFFHWFTTLPFPFSVLALPPRAAFLYFF